MPRELSPRDLDILRKLAPELESVICSGSGVEFRSILPPVSNHFAMDEEDLAERLERLSADDLSYISDLIADGSESLGCLGPEAAEVFFEILERKLSRNDAQRARTIYETGGECYL